MGKKGAKHQCNTMSVNWFGSSWEVGGTSNEELRPWHDIDNLNWYLRKGSLRVAFRLRPFHMREAFGKGKGNDGPLAGLAVGILLGTGNRDLRPNTSFSVIGGYRRVSSFESEQI